MASTKYLKYGVFLISVVIAYSTYASSKKVDNLRSSGERAYNTENYQEALAFYEQVLLFYQKKGKQAEAGDYTKAGLSALALREEYKALEYLESALRLESEDTLVYMNLGKLYKQKDNLSKEIQVLEACITKFPGTAISKRVTARLFETYIESENWQKAAALLPSFDENVKEDTAFLENYLRLNMAMEDVEKAEETAASLLTKKKNNILALQWYAEKYYWRAEHRYQKEMLSYEKNKTHSQYAKLLQALDKATLDFKKAGDYYKKLYAIEQSPLYAKYLANIYARLNDKKKAAYYRKLEK